MSGGDPRKADAAFDPERFMAYAGQVGHSGALGIAYHDRGDDWVELSLPYAEHLIGMPESGIVALILLAVQDRAPAEILALDIEQALAPFDLRNQLSSNRTQGIPNMIALIRETAGRLAS